MKIQIWNSRKGLRPWAYVLLAVTIVFAFFQPLDGNPPPVRAVGPYVVNINTDGPDYNHLDGICYDGATGCTLRAAIDQAAHDGGVTTITFSITPGTTLLIDPLYGQILVDGNNITIDGQDKNITISGQLQNASDEGVIRISGSNNTIKNLSIRDSPWDGVQMGDFANVGSGNNNKLDHVNIYRSVASGVYIHGSNAGGGNQNKVWYSLIGAAQLSDTQCTSSIGNGAYGIYINEAADYSDIVGNRIVCNDLDGVNIDGSGGDCMQTTINFNDIGTDGNSTELGNGGDGVHDNHNIWTTINWNVISGNGNYGIWLQGATEAGIYGNKVGVSESSGYAIPNNFDGIYITDNANGNHIGDPFNVDLRNVISGNGYCGVAITSGAYGNFVDGNYIGLGGVDVVVSNGYAGVGFFGAGPNNSLGTGTATVKQYIAGNLREGVYVQNSTGVEIWGSTYIGLAGSDTPSGNGLQGVFLDTGTTFSSIMPSAIMYNGGAGIAVAGDTSVSNYLFPKKVTANGGLPVDLGNDGATANGVHSPPGPNNWMNYPLVSTLSAGSFTGTTCPNCIVIFYKVNDNPRDIGGGGTFLTWVYASGTGSFNYTFPATSPEITMIACDVPTNNCSEMSPVVTNPGASKIFLPFLIK
jgi:hypothetical protein